KSNLWHFSHLYEITGCDSLLSSAEFRLDRRRSVGQALASLTGRTGCGGSGTDPERRLRRNKYTPPPAGISRNGESETLNYYRKSLRMNSLISNSFGWNILREMIFSCPLFSIFCEEVGGGGYPLVCRAETGGQRECVRFLETSHRYAGRSNDQAEGIGRGGRR